MWFSNKQREEEAVWHEFREDTYRYTANSGREFKKHDFSPGQTHKNSYNNYDLEELYSTLPKLVVQPKNNLEDKSLVTPPFVSTTPIETTALPIPKNNTEDKSLVKLPSEPTTLVETTALPPPLIDRDINVSRDENVGEMLLEAIQCENVPLPSDDQWSDEDSEATKVDSVHHTNNVSKSDSEVAKSSTNEEKGVITKKTVRPSIQLYVAGRNSISYDKTSRHRRKSNYLTASSSTDTLAQNNSQDNNDQAEFKLVTFNIYHIYLLLIQKVFTNIYFHSY